MLHIVIIIFLLAMGDSTVNQRVVTAAVPLTVWLAAAAEAAVVVMVVAGEIEQCKQDRIAGTVTVTVMAIHRCRDVDTKGLLKVVSGQVLLEETGWSAPVRTTGAVIEAAEIISR